VVLVIFFVFIIFAVNMPAYGDDDVDEGPNYEAGQKKQYSVGIDYVKKASDLVRGLEQFSDDVPHQIKARRKENKGGRMVKYNARKGREVAKKRAETPIKPVSSASRQSQFPLSHRLAILSGFLLTFHLWLPTERRA
jgi:hypothetical protein